MNEKGKQRKKKKQSRVAEPYLVTRAVTHIRLIEVNPGKLVALEALASVYLALSQAYVTLFCTTEPPNKLRDPLYQTPLSERWHRVAIMQAAGIARSWRSNRTTAYQQYQDDLERYHNKLAEYHSQRPACPAQAGSSQAPTQSQIARLSQEERRQETALHQQSHRTETHSAYTARDQPRREPVLY